MENRNDGAEASYATGQLNHDDSNPRTEFTPTAPAEWLFATRTRCENPVYPEPGQLVGVRCESTQPFSTSEPAQLLATIEEDGWVTLDDPNGPWTVDFLGQCMGDMLYGSSGDDMWIFSFQKLPKPEVPR